MMEIAIFDHGELGKPCAEACGMDWLSLENQQLARHSLEMRFGQKISVDFHNLAEPSAQAQFPQLLKQIEKERLYLPLLLIDGEVRINGHFDLRMLLDMVEAERELARG